MTKTRANLIVAEIAMRAGQDARAMLYINAACCHALTELDSDQAGKIRSFANSFRLAHFGHPHNFGIAESL